MSGSDDYSDLDEKKLLELVRISEMAERYDDMCKFIKRLVEKKSKASVELTVEERNLLSVAYKNVVGSKRASWRTLTADDEDPDANEKLIETYRAIVETELEEKCNEVIGILTDSLVPTVEGKGDETEVFYLKMAGDYYRYLCEFSKKDEYKKNSEKYYSKALEIAQGLPETHPTRLGLALNFSVCYYEILGEQTKACDLAKKAFDDAIEKLDQIKESSYKDATLIMQLLRDNLTLWTASDEANDAGD
jgi:hypothetical protein